MKHLATFIFIFLGFNLTIAQNFVDLNSGVTSQLTSVDFLNDDLGYVVGQFGTILKTSDGGQNWIAQTSSVTSNLTEVLVLDSNIVYAVGKNGVILKTNNGGVAWTALNSGTSGDLDRIDFVNGDLYVSGDNGKIVKSTDQGVSWSTLTSGTGTGLYELFFVNATTGFVVGKSGTIRKTTDGGNSWSALNSGTSESWLGVYFIDAMNGVAVGGNSASNTGVILTTNDGGISWVKTTVADNYFMHVEFLDNNVGYISGGSVSGNSSTIYKTIDGGATWNTASSNSDRQIDVSVASSETVYTCGLNGSILKMDNSSVGIKNNINQLHLISLFPNPTNDFLNVKIDQDISKSQLELVVYNQIGMSVWSQNDLTPINVSEFVEGVYFLKTSWGNQTVVKKFIVE